MIKIVIYEDNVQLQEALCLLLNGDGAFSVVGRNTHCQNAVQEIEQLKPDIVLMDIDLPGRNGIDGLKEIRKADQLVKVVMFTLFADDDLKALSRQHGANGYLLKKTNPLKLIENLKAAHEGAVFF